MEKWMMGIFLVIGSVEDVKKKEISGIYLGTFFLIGLAVRSVELFFGNEISPVVSWIAGGAAGVILAGVAKLTREAIGYGDAFTAAVLGIWLGFPALIEILFVALFLSAVYSAWLIFVKSTGGKYRIAFLPFLAAGYLIWLLLTGEGDSR
ncbi:A24 family peptidase [Lachnospiraceae bacterium 46-15]